jgi:RNA-directed DNA polymerase
VVPRVKTSGARLRKKLKRVNAWARAMRNRHRLPELWETCCAKLRGHILDSGVSYNQVAVRTFVLKATRHLFKWLNRQSQRKSFSWERFVQSHPLPTVRVHHALLPSQQARE